MDTTAPSAAVSFPPPGARTDASDVTVRGTASDPSGVRSVRVNGVAVESSDGFAHWRLTVALAPGDNVLQVRTEDRAGNVDGAVLEWTVTRAEERLITPTALASDAARNRLLVADAALDRLSAVDPFSGAVATVSDEGSSGISFASPAGADVDAGRDRAIVVDRARNELIAVDLGDGSRSVLEEAGVFSGPFQPIDVALDALRDVAYVSEN